MVCFHNRYSLGDKHDYSSNNYNGWDEMKKAIIRKEDVAVILPLYLYDHSGITMNTTGFSCNWDSGQVGFIYMTKKDAIENWGKKILTSKVIEKAKQCLIGEVKVYDQFLQGDIFGFKVKTIDTKEELDSCWGFYGDEADNGIYEHINVEVLTFERYKEVFDDANWV